ncbi:MAG: hypothetical protein CVU66_00710 [Deltaproteobacteria bacterium HGW-Deltaproteobacteria-23]|nr:MAG: hypothetical protein CVU66_00710 [Deltaproteobacteria bacterium HGW-Deltaproteobacteria-23]
MTLDEISVETLLDRLQTYNSEPIENKSSDIYSRASKENAAYAKGNYSDQKEALDLKRGNLEIIHKKNIFLFAMLLVVAWIAFVMIVIISNSIGYVPFFKNSWDMSDVTLVALITTTTANIIFIIHVIVKNLYPGLNNINNNDNSQ